MKMVRICDITSRPHRNINAHCGRSSALSFVALCQGDFTQKEKRCGGHKSEKKTTRQARTHHSRLARACTYMSTKKDRANSSDEAMKRRKRSLEPGQWRRVEEETKKKRKKRSHNSAMAIVPKAPIPFLIFLKLRFLLGYQIWMKMRGVEEGGIASLRVQDTQSLSVSECENPVGSAPRDSISLSLTPTSREKKIERPRPCPWTILMSAQRLSDEIMRHDAYAYPHIQGGGGSLFKEKDQRDGQDDEEGDGEPGDGDFFLKKKQSIRKYGTPSNAKHHRRDTLALASRVEHSSFFIVARLCSHHRWRYFFFSHFILSCPHILT